jgi:ABC-type phosphate transport system permease subunit
MYKPLYNTGVSFYNAITNTRRDQENNTIAYYKQVTNALLREVIIELRAFYIAFMAAVSIRSYSRTKTFTNFISTRLKRQEIVV